MEILQNNHHNDDEEEEEKPPLLDCHYPVESPTTVSFRSSRVHPMVV
jgi:hypothetical protein